MAGRGSGPALAIPLGRGWQQLLIQSRHEFQFVAATDQSWCDYKSDIRILMSSASLSEDSLGRVCGEKVYNTLPTHWVNYMGISSLMFNSDTLGIKRGEVRVFYKHPQRSNIFQQVRSVEDFSTRFDWSDLCTLVLSGNMWNVYFLGITPISWFRLSDEALGFLLPLAASGKKIQVHSIVLDFDRVEMRSLSKICPRCFVPPWTWLTKLVSPQLTVYRHLSDLCVLCHPMHPMPPQCLYCTQVAGLKEDSSRQGSMCLCQR